MTPQELLQEALKLQDRDSLSRLTNFVLTALELNERDPNTKTIKEILTKKRGSLNALSIVNQLFSDSEISFTEKEISDLNTSYIATQSIPTKSDLESLAIWMDLLTEYYDESEVFRKHLTNLASLTWCDKTKSILAELSMLAGEGIDFNETCRMVTQSDSMSY